MKRLALVMAVLLFAVPAFAVDVTLTWEKPLKNTDGTDYLDHGGYTVYQGTETGVYDKEYEVVGEITEYKIEGLGEGTYYFAVTAWDDKLQRNESEKSNESAQTTTTTPDPPVLREIKVTITGNKVTLERSEPVAALVIPRLETAIDKINALVIH